MPPKPPAWGRAKDAPPTPEPPQKAKQKQAKTAAAPTVVKEVVSTGTNVMVIANGTNCLGRTHFVEPTSPTAVITNMVNRAQMDPNAPPVEPLSPTITGLAQTVRAMAMGQDIAPFRDHIQQVASNQPEKGDVVRAFVNQANHELIADVVEMRADAVRHIKRATRTNGVTVGEAIVVWKMTNDLLPALTDGLNKNDRAVDTVTVVEKIDYQRQQVERSVQKRWEGTTPQGREIIRKKLWELKRQLQLEQGILPPGLETPPELVAEEVVETPVPAT
jgi:hypothetical protein